MPFSIGFALSALSTRARRKCSGAKLGMPVKRSASPSVSVSPMRIVPWLGTPMMSPGKASSTPARLRAWNSIALPTRRSRSLRCRRTRRPRSKRPETMRTNATRSRCAGSMLAWILKTRPVKPASAGSTVRSVAARGCGGGAISTNVSSIASTPSPPRAMPKKTGVSVPAR